MLVEYMYAWEARFTQPMSRCPKISLLKLQEAFTCVREKFCSATMGTFMMAAVSLVLGKGAKERRQVAQLFDRLVKANMASRTQCTKGTGGINHDSIDLSLQSFFYSAPYQVIQSNCN